MGKGTVRGLPSSSRITSRLSPRARSAAGAFSGSSTGPRKTRHPAPPSRGGRNDTVDAAAVELGAVVDAATGAALGAEEAETGAETTATDAEGAGEG